MKNIFKKEFVYNTDDLYVGALGYVKNNWEKGMLKCYDYKDNPTIIIFKKEKYNEFDSPYYGESFAKNVFNGQNYFFKNNYKYYNGQYCAKNIFNGDEYLFLKDNNKSYSTAKKMIDNYVVYEMTPLKEFFNEPKKTLTKDELLVAYEIIKTDYKKETLTKKHSLKK